MNIGPSYNLEIEKIIRCVNKNNYDRVILQFPDGLKYYSKQIVDVLNQKTKAKIFTYFGSCFGACDIPLHLKELEIDLCIQFGHNVYIKRKNLW